jgi:hypothetical protein
VRVLMDLVGVHANEQHALEERIGIERQASCVHPREAGFEANGQEQDWVPGRQQIEARTAGG